MAFSTNAAIEGAGTGAAEGTEVMPGWGTAIGAAAGFVLGGIAGGKQEQENKKMQEAVGQMVQGGMGAAGELAPFSTGGAEAYGAARGAITSMPMNAEAQYYAKEKLADYTRKMRAGGKSLSGEFVRGGMDTYLGAFAEANKAITAPSIQAAQIGAQAATSQMSGIASMTAAKFGMATPGQQSPWATLVGAAGSWASNSFRPKGKAQPDYALAYAKSNSVFNPYYGGGMGSMT